MKKHCEILEKVMKILVDKEKMNLFMDEFNKEEESKEDHVNFIKKRVRKVCIMANVSLKDYIEALSVSKRGYVIVQRRDVDEIFVNSYNKEWIRAWNANMDLQICLDFFSVITYITDYYSKDDTGTMKVINKALKENDCKDVKDQMKLISNVFLTSRQMGEAEAVYRLIPSMNLKGSNVTCQWVPTEPSEERSKRFRKASDAQMNSGIKVFQLEGHDGYFYEVQDIYSKYLRRPKELRECCFAQFSKMYRSKTQSFEENKTDVKMGKFDDIESEKIDELPDNECEMEIEENFESFHYIITYDNASQKIPLPSEIYLSNVQSGESPVMKKRNFPAAL